MGGLSQQLTLRELRSTTGAAETGLLAFLHAAVAGEEALLAELAVELQSVDAELSSIEEEWLELAAEAEERGLTLD